LIVEDNLDLARVLQDGFRSEGLEVFIARSGREGISVAAARPPALITLDLILPDVDGTYVLRALRAAPATSRTPVIVVSARADEIDRVVLFELGADDYVTKPFSLRELLLRARVWLRRAARGAELEASKTRFGCLTLDNAAHEAFVEGERVSLTQLEFALLGALFAGRSRVQSRAELLHAIAPGRAALGPRNVDSHVKRLRFKLGAAAGYVHTVRGFGYRFASSPEDLWQGTAAVEEPPPRASQKPPRGGPAR
jgi:two-component system phosphate regulon response regulator PhoB